ncbi:ankyrin [Patellaria atrata CBS 101060]|uniref:Ankyrin n=1 Tax=Patellaria atrata CBS 101060 TaxID=1346257 RepID=A0A9P4VML5_9PEZI|nr:ankyrin [Patellaria atrata CBS 101060]
MLIRCMFKTFRCIAQIDVSLRLRRAILLNDLSLVRRIIKNNPNQLQNPDFEDKSNTSLHIAAKAGFVQIVEFLITAGHEDDGISRNTDWSTALMLAAENKQLETGKLLIERFPRCIPWTNKEGLDALSLSALHTPPLLPPLLSSSIPVLHRPVPDARDAAGNTALHHASAAGELKSIRLLLAAGWSPHIANAYSWTPVAYSATVAAERYFRSLVLEMERGRMAVAPTGTEGVGQGHRRRRAGDVRLVLEDAGAAFGADVAPVTPGIMTAEEERAGLDWSPVERRRAMTPTAGRSEWQGLTQAQAQAMRARAGSGD